MRRKKAEVYDAVFILQKLEDNIQKRNGEKFFLSGNQWALEGDILQLNPPLFFKGVTLYKITRIKARFLNPYKPNFSPGITYNLKKRDALWEFLNKYRFSFIEATSSSTGYNPIKSKKEFYLYLDRSRFVLKNN
jgi:hypothetical protein